MGQETVYSDFVRESDDVLAGFSAVSYANLGCGDPTRCAANGYCRVVRALVGKSESEIKLAINRAKEVCPPFAPLVDAAGL